MFSSDSQRKACFANMRDGFSNRVSCFSNVPFDPKKTLELLEAGMFDPHTLTDEQKAQIEVVQEESKAAGRKALRALDERIARGDTYKPKELWSVGSKNSVDDLIIEKTVFKNPKEWDIRAKKAIEGFDESRFSSHIKYPIRERISIRLSDPGRLDLEYDGEKKSITDPAEIDYVRRTVGSFAAKKLDEGTRLNEHDIYGDGRRAMDLMFGRGVKE